jgi:hypothetical protein
MGQFTSLPTVQGWGGARICVASNALSCRTRRARYIQECRIRTEPSTKARSIAIGWGGLQKRSDGREASHAGHCHEQGLEVGPCASPCEHLHTVINQLEVDTRFFKINCPSMLPHVRLEFEVWLLLFRNPRRVYSRHISTSSAQR